MVYDASDRAANLASIESAQPAFAFPTIGVRPIHGLCAPASHGAIRRFGDAATYDLIIVENALYCLAYPLVQLHQLHGVRVAYWGHGRIFVPVCNPVCQAADGTAQDGACAG